MSDDPAPPRRSRSAALTWIALACALVVLVVAVAQRRDRPASDRTVGEVTRVGVTDGASIPAYLRAAGDELARLDAPDGYALVSFGDYLTPARAAAALDGTRVSAVVARVPLPAGRPRSSGSRHCACRRTWWPGWPPSRRARTGRPRTTGPAPPRPQAMRSCAGCTTAARGPPPARRRRTGRAAPASTPRWSCRAGLPARARRPSGRAGGGPGAGGDPSGPDRVHPAAARAA
nr:hypothetical protein [Micromonospora provocatoris]